MILFSENISTFAMCDLGYYDYGARLKRTQKELLNLNDYLLTQEVWKMFRKQGVCLQAHTVAKPAVLFLFGDCRPQCL